MELFVLVIGLVSFALLANRFGAESRDGFGALDQRSDAVLTKSDLAYEQQLAWETRDARRRRLARAEGGHTPLRRAGTDLTRAA